MLGLFVVRSSGALPKGSPRFTLLELWMFLLLVVAGIVVGYGLEGIEALDTLADQVRHRPSHG